MPGALIKKSSFDRVLKHPLVLPLKRPLVRAINAFFDAWQKAKARAALPVEAFATARAVKLGSILIGPLGEIEPLCRGAAVRDAATNREEFAFTPIAAVGNIGIVRIANVDPIIKELAQLRERVRLAGAGRAQPAIRRKAGDGKRPDRRSIAFMNNCYYNFFYLAAALRRRGWDAVSVSTEDPGGPHAQFYHDEDLNLFDPDPERFELNLLRFLSEAENRFRMVHFYGVGTISLFRAYFDPSRDFRRVPVDVIRLRQRGIKIGYTVAGCLDGVAQSSIRSWSGACDKCVWQDHPEVCSDSGNLAWGRKVNTICDLIDTGGSPALDWKGRLDKVCRDPLVMALDPDLWKPNLAVPEKYRLARAPGELIVYHAVGNYNLRSRGSRNVKGTGAILAAIERLKGEGVPVRLEFVTDVPSKDMRFIQVQADVIVDQLNYGRYGAQATEALMLGRPTICYINKDEPAGVRKLEFVENSPIVSATEDTIYAELKGLLLDDGRRRRLERASREFALRWHSADACAERYERVYDRLMSGLAPVENA